MNLDIGKHKLSGLLLMKKVPDSSIRIIFTNEIGMKFFDFEFRDGKFIIHYIFPSMNKKMLISLFRKDFTLILMHEKMIRKTGIVKSRDASINEYKVSSKEGTFLYQVSSSSRMIEEIRSFGSMIQKTIIRPEYKNNADIPGKIRFFNPGIKLSAVLTFLSE